MLNSIYKIKNKVKSIQEKFGENEIIKIIGFKNELVLFTGNRKIIERFSITEEMKIKLNKKFAGYGFSIFTTTDYFLANI